MHGEAVDKKIKTPNVKLGAKRKNKTLRRNNRNNRGRLPIKLAGRVGNLFARAESLNNSNGPSVSLSSLLNR